MIERSKFMSEGSGGTGPETPISTAPITPELRPVTGAPTLGETRPLHTVVERPTEVPVAEGALRHITEGGFNVFFDSKGREVKRIPVIAGGAPDDEDSKELEKSDQKQQEASIDDQDNKAHAGKTDPEYLEFLERSLGVKFGAVPENERQEIESGYSERGAGAYRDYFQLGIKIDRDQADNKRGSYYYIDRDGIRHETEDAFVELSVGPVPVKVPAEPKEKWKYLSNALVQMEETRAEGGGPGIEQQVSRAQTMLAALESPQYLAAHRDSSNDPNFEIGKKLYQEFVARVELHKLFYGFTNASGIDRVGENLISLKQNTLNKLLQNNDFHKEGEVRKMMYYYELALASPDSVSDDKKREIQSQYPFAFTQEYIKLRESERPEFRRQLCEQLAKEIGHGKAEDYAWSQLAAEKILTLWARVTSQDKERKADYNGGNYFVRKLLQFSGWVDSNKANFNFSSEVLFPKEHGPVKSIDFNQDDYLNANDHGFLAKFFGDLKYRKERGDEILEAEDRGKTGVPSKPDEYALWKLNQITNGQVELSVRDNTKKENPIKEVKWVNRDLINFSQIDWDQLDFQKSGDSPLLDWANYHIVNPDKARAKLTDGFLKHPTMKALFELKDVFEYSAGRQWERKNQMLINTLDYLMSRKGAKHHKGERMRVKAADSEIIEAVKHGFIKAEDMESVKSKVIAPKFIRDAGLTFLYFNFFKGFFDMVSDMFKQSTASLAK